MLHTNEPGLLSVLPACLQEDDNEHAHNNVARAVSSRAELYVASALAIHTLSANCHLLCHI